MSFEPRKEIQMTKESLGFLDFFSNIPDHRIARKRLYSVEEIMLVTFCGVIAGCEGWDDIELFGETKLDFLRKFYPFKAGVPSDDTLRRFFRILDPGKFEACFIEWVKSFQIDLESKVVAIDGKTLRRSFDGDSKPLHLLNAFVSEIGVVLGQLKVADKSNEITAIPCLLEILDLKNAIVTIDAMGCQTDIAEKIITKEADYILALKGNQGQLHKDVKLAFEQRIPGIDYIDYQDIDKGHGRIETRRCVVTDNIDWLRKEHPKWTNLNCIIEIESIRNINAKETREKRYYISSLKNDPKIILQAIRNHWGIENKLHWVLDVSFGEDQSRIRKGNAPQNISLIKKTALNLLQIIKETMPRISLKRMKKLAGWDNEFLLTVLSAQF